jgi:hypothetical protein
MIADRLDDLIAQIERGETPDVKRFETLVALDLVRMGEAALDDAIARDKAADAKYEQFIESIGN